MRRAASLLHGAFESCPKNSRNAENVFDNLPELMSMFKEVADIQTANAHAGLWHRCRAGGWNITHRHWADHVVFR